MFDFLFPIDKALVEENVSRLQKQMLATQMDCLILQRGDNVRYVASLPAYDSFYLGHEHLAILPVEGEPVILTANRYAQFLQEHHWIKDIRPLTAKADHPCPPILLQVLEEYHLNTGTIGLDPFMNTVLSRSLIDKLPAATFRDGSKILWQTRMIKSDKEIEIIEDAVQIAEIGLRAGIDNLEEGMRECELSGIIVNAVIAAGGQGLYAVPAIVSSGERWERCEEFPSEKRIRRGELINMDEGPLYKGYYGEFARMLMIGPPSEDQKKLYQTTFKAHSEAIKAVRPGVTPADLVAITQRIISENGLERFAEDGIGHGLGMSSAEPPWITKRDTYPLQPGMFIAIEPSIFVPGVGGCRFEDNILVTEDGYRQLSRTEHPEIEKFFDSY